MLRGQRGRTDMQISGSKTRFERERAHLRAKFCCRLIFFEMRYWSQDELLQSGNSRAIPHIDPGSLVEKVFSWCSGYAAIHYSGSALEVQAES